MNQTTFVYGKELFVDMALFYYTHWTQPTWCYYGGCCRKKCWLLFAVSSKTCDLGRVRERVYKGCYNTDT